MSRTIGGHFFKCKTCGKSHFFPQEPYRGIRLPCVSSKYAINTYNKKDFSRYWSGYYGEVSGNIVHEVEN